MVQIVENRAGITGTIESAEADGTSLRIRVDGVTDVPGYPNLAQDAMGESINVVVPATDARELVPGTRVRCELRKIGIDRYAVQPGSLQL